MYEQISIFDIINDETKPYQYDWIRTEGMQVVYELNGKKGIGTIHSFDHYYTFVESEDGTMLACTKLNCWPKEGDKNDTV